MRDRASHAQTLGESMAYRTVLDSFVNLSLRDFKAAQEKATIIGIPEDILDQLYLQKDIMECARKIHKGF